MPNNNRVRQLTTRAIKHLKWLGKRVPPRVHQANIRLHLNGWHTKRRYQEDGCCEFCGKKGSEDSIEHFFYCSIVQDLLPAALKLGSPARAPISTFFLFGLDGKTRILMALYVFGIYTLHNKIRHSKETRELRHSLHSIISSVPLHADIRKAWADMCGVYS